MFMEYGRITKEKYILVERAGRDFRKGKKLSLKMS